MNFWSNSGGHDDYHRVICILQAFSLFDTDGTGRITFENLKQVTQELGESIDDDELREMIAEADRDGDGGVDPEEFLKIMKKTCLY